MRTTLVRIAVVVALLAGSARAQDSWVSTPEEKPNLTLFTFNWEISGPIGSFSNYISDTGLRGASIETRSFLGQSISVGLSFSWNRWEQTFDMVKVPITNGTASGPVYRYADLFGIRALAHYYAGRGALRPYVGFGIGGAWNYAFQQIADLSKSQNNFNFIVDPEIGLLYWFARGGTDAGLNLAFRYTYTTAKMGRESNAQFLSGIIGVTFGY